MDQNDFFNSMAESWDTICRHDQDKVNEILNLTDIQKGSKVLDVGTGTGVMIPYLIPFIGNTGEITAVDKAEKMIEIAESKHLYDNVTFLVSDIFDLHLSPNYFDLVMCYSVFPHFESQLLGIETLGKFLKPGGKIVICHSQSRNEINKMHKNASQAVSKDNLPHANIIKEYFSSCNMDTIVEVDNDRMFVIIGQKKDI